MPPSNRIRPHLWLIKVLGLIVPRRLRSDWKQEWEAELRHREALLVEWERLNRRTKLDLLRRSLGSFWDALCLQPQRVEDEMFQDLRYGLRMLWNKPAFTLVAVLTLALGIGLNSAIFSVVNAVLLRPLPYHKANELMMFYFTNPRGEEEWFVSSAAYQNLKSQTSVFTDVAAWGNSTWPANLTGDGEPERLQGFQVSANFFHVLGVAPALGRTFLAEEDRPGNNYQVVISHDLWRRRFGGDPGMIGRSILLNSTAYNVIGVMPADFRFILNTDVWSPFALTPAAEIDRNSANLHSLARLKPDVSSAQARAEVDNILRPHLSNPNSNMRAHLKSLQTVLTVGERDMLFILFAAVGFVLLIACLNVANLLLARASVRRRELTIRVALGAGRLRLVRQLLVESALLAFFGGAGALMLANWCIRFLVSGLPESVAAKNSHVAMLELDGWALGYTITLSFLTTFIFGLLPALRTSKVNLNEMLKVSGRSEAQDHTQNRFRSWLVVTEVALATLLLTGAGLMLKSFWQLSNIDRGFEAGGVLTAKIDPLVDGYLEAPQVVAFYRQVLERLSAIPGAQHVGIINSWDYGWRVAVVGRPEVPDEQRPLASRHPVSSSYFRAMGIPLRAGRFFTDRDVKGAPLIAIIDETLARRHFPDENPIGKHLRFQDAVREIVGVVGATRAWKRYSFGSNEAFPHVYVPYQQFTCDEQVNCWSMSLMLRAQSGGASSFIPAIRRELALIDKDQPIHSFKLLEQSVTELNADRRFSAVLLAAFAALAALLAAVGIYGVMSYFVAQRTHEIGIRMALGAPRGDVLRMVMGRGMKLVLIGIGIGAVSAFALTRLMRGLLYGVSAGDPLTFAFVAVLLTVVALVACYLPARRAIRVDPVIALKYE